MLSMSFFSHDSVKHNILWFLMSLGRILLIRAHPFSYPMIALWLIGLMVEADYPLAVGILQGTSIYVPDISVSSSCE